MYKRLYHNFLEAFVMKRRISAVIMALVTVLGTFACVSLTANAETKQYPVGAQVYAVVDTVNNLLEFRSGAPAGSDPVKMNAITIGNAPWKEYADRIEHIIIRDGVLNVTDGAGSGLPNLKDITIGKDVAEIEPRAFINSPAIEQFNVDENSKVFRSIDSKRILIRKEEVAGKAYFSIVRAVTSLTSYVFPESIDDKGTEHINAIDAYAFYGASKLSRIKLNSDLISIGDYAFSGCAIKGDPNANDAIRVLTIPESVRIIGEHAFEGNLFNTTSFSYNLNTIGENAFANCEALTEITAINNPVLLVERNAFLNTNLNNGTTLISFNGSSAEWSEVIRRDDTLSRLSSTRYASINPHNKEYIAYDINGGSVFTIPENQNHIKKDSSLNITSVDPIKNEDADGFGVYPLHPTKYFAGWSTEKLDQVMLDTSLYQPGDTFDTDTLNKHPSIRLYAAWTDEINLVFNANGGTLAQGLESVKKEQPVNSYKLPKAEPTHKKYSFVGWSTDKNATDADYQPEDTIKLNKNTILYAVWNTTGPYDITIDAAGGKLSDGNSKKVLSNAKEKGVDYTVNEPNPTRDRYEFKGWSVDGGATTMSPVVKTDYNTTVKAVWTFTGPCYIRYSIDGRIDSSKSLDVPIGTTVTIPAAAEKDGYIFLGWRDYSKVYQPGETFTATKDSTLDAYFEKINPTKESEISLKKKYDITADFGSRVHITATVTKVPEGYELWIYKDGEAVKGGAVTDGELTLDWTSDKLNADTVITVKLIDQAGKVARNEKLPLMSTVNVSVKTGFFARIIAFFKGLFGLLETVEIR